MKKHKQYEDSKTHEDKWLNVVRKQVDPKNAAADDKMAYMTTVISSLTGRLKALEEMIQKDKTINRLETNNNR